MAKCLSRVSKAFEFYERLKPFETLLECLRKPLSPCDREI